jgi:hypothetical protein
MRRKRWLVISWMQEEFGWVAFDTLFAATESEAEQAVLKVRGDRCTVSEVLRPKEFSARLASLSALTPAQVNSSWRLTTWLRTGASSAVSRKAGDLAIS